MNDDAKTKMYELMKLVGGSTQKAAKYKKQMREYIDGGKFRETVAPLVEILKPEIDRYEKCRLEDTKKETESKEALYLAHYTGVDTMHSILVSNETNNKSGDFLRLYGAFSMNDPSEGLYLRNEFAKEHKWLIDAERNTDAFICSFVSDGPGIGNRITYWQSYGMDGLGCSIQVSPHCSLNEHVQPVLYGKEEAKKVEDKFKNYLALGGELHKSCSEKEGKDFATAFWKAFDKIKFSHKHDGYVYENEYRMIKIPDAEEKIEDDFRSKEPYYRRYVLNEDLRANRLLISGTEVFIGPRVRNKERLRQYFEKLAKKGQLDGVKFTPSRIPYRGGE